MLHVIVNPQSRSGNGLSIWTEAEKELNKNGIPYEVHYTQGPGDAIRIARELTDEKSIPEGEKRIVAAMGGDGTLGEVSNGVGENAKVIMAYLPSGSGNDFARSMQYPDRIAELVKNLSDDAETELVDSGMLTLPEKNYRFMVSCGIGFDAAICDDLFHSGIKKAMNAIHMGSLSYIIVGIRQLIRMKPVKAVLTVDGKEIEIDRLCFMSAHVQPFEGGGFRFAPNADPRDKKLELCVVSGTGAWGLVSVLIGGLGGKALKSSHVTYYSCEKATIRLAEARHVHTDGEVHGLRSEITVSNGGTPFVMVRQ